MSHAPSSLRCHRRMLFRIVALVVAASATGLSAWSAGTKPAHAVLAAASESTVSAPLPAGFTRFISKVLPYSIGYPPGWRAEGSIFGSMRRPSGVYYDADTFSKKGAGSIVVQGEGLPPGSLLTSEGYAELALLELQRSKEADPSFSYKAMRMGTIGVDGTSAYLLDYTRGTGADKLRVTEAVWVARGKGWRAGLTTPMVGAAHDALVPVFTAMLKTIRLR